MRDAVELAAAVLVGFALVLLVLICLACEGGTPVEETEPGPCALLSDGIHRCVFPEAVCYYQYAGGVWCHRTGVPPSEVNGVY